MIITSLMNRMLSALSGLFLLATAAMAQGPISAQWCGTRDGRVAWLEEYQQNPHSYPRSADTLLVPITLHLVGTTGGSGFFPMPELLDAFCVLNQDFAPYGIRFYINFPIRYIANSEWYNHNFQTGAEMMEIHNVANTINCYISESPAPGVCGYSDYGRGVALAKNCTNDGKHTWAHEIGHFLSLPHTFFGWEGIEHDYSQAAPDLVNYGRLAERVDSIDCELASDGFCDTPPDYLNFRWACNLDKESNLQQTDPTGMTFRSQARYFMSYATDACMSVFSPQQSEAMRANLLTEKVDMLSDPTPVPDISDTETTPIYPVDGDTLPYYNKVLISWEPIEGATHYLIEMSAKADFTGPIFRRDVEGTSFVREGGIKEQTYYWRLRPYNRGITCGLLSDVFSYTTGQGPVSGIPVLPGMEEWTVYPNPAEAGTGPGMRLRMERDEEVMLRLLSASGQIMGEARLNLSAGMQEVPLPFRVEGGGWFVLQMTGREGVAHRRFVVRP